MAATRTFEIHSIEYKRIPLPHYKIVWLDNGQPVTHDVLPSQVPGMTLDQVEQPIDPNTYLVQRSELGGNPIYHLIPNTA